MDWQQAAAILIVAGAFFWLLRRALRARSGGCGGCGGCATRPETPAATPLIRLDAPPSPPSSGRRLPTRRPAR